MTTYHITNEIYEMIAERCTGTFSWDCIELANGFAIVFASKDGKPYDVEVRDENDDVIAHDFSFKGFAQVA